MLTRRRLASLVIACCVPALPATTSLAQELRLGASADDVVVELDAAGSLAWNLYRGDLSALGAWMQRGDPHGRCWRPGADAELVLADERALAGSHYYLAAAVSADGTEAELGRSSFGELRLNTFPCSPLSDCHAGGVPTNLDVDWTLFSGAPQSPSSPPPAFAALNRDGSARSEDDLLGGPTILWFYPRAGTAG